MAKFFTTWLVVIVVILSVTCFAAAGKKDKDKEKGKGKEKGGKSKGKDGGKADPTIIESDKRTDNGEWGEMENCPEGTFAQGFQAKTDEKKATGMGDGKQDDTGLNAVKLFCGNPDENKTIISKEGPWGNWGKVFRCFPGALIGFSLKVEKFIGDKDDTGTNNIRFWCAKKPGLSRQITGDGTQWGAWGEQHYCKKGDGICGIQTQVEANKGDDAHSDDTSLNNVKFKCCPVAFLAVEGAEPPPPDDGKSAEFEEPKTEPEITRETPRESKKSGEAKPTAKSSSKKKSTTTTKKPNAEKKFGLF